MTREAAAKEPNMEHSEMVALIRGGVVTTKATWADLGAGTGNFTWALAALLDLEAVIYAIDRDARAIIAQGQRMLHDAPRATVIPRQADFTQRLDLPPLDGALLANSLHFIRDQRRVLASVVQLLRPGGRLLLVEYEVSDPIRWVPFPVPFHRFAALASELNLEPPQLLGQRRSPSSGIVLYAGLALWSHGIVAH